VSDPGSVPGPQDIQDVVQAIELHENDDACGSEVIIAETGLDHSVVLTVLSHLWQEDRIEGLATGWVGLPPITFFGVRRVIPGRARLWGERGRFKEH
jgi:hypothetical protein